MDETINDGSSIHSLIPEKEATFSPKSTLFFKDYLNQFTEFFDLPLDNWKRWEDETVLLVLQEKNIHLSSLDRNKLLAYKNFNANDCYISTPLEFKNMAMIINDDVPVTAVCDTIDPAYIAWAIEVLEKYDENHEVTLTDEVVTYIAICFYDEGFIHMPEDLQIFQEELDKLNVQTPIKKETNEKILRINDYLAAKRGAE